ncbi:MAG: GatB/YqeY domain-containing protein [Telmatospirillum sp.]|nr:GatB/YqeY domain-containing protein [Telmatospirillum sp.]
MTLRTSFTDAMKEAMKAKDVARLGAVRMAMAELKKRDIDARATGNMDGISDGEILAMLQKMIASRRDSIALYNQGGRPELAQAEAAEIAVLESFLPQQMSAAEMEAAIAAAVAETGASSLKDMGKVMAIVKAKYTGQMDLGAASAAIKKRLGG